MTDSEKGRKPEPEDASSVGTPEALQESLDELARSVDDLVDRLTMDMTDAPVEPASETPSAGAELATEAPPVETEKSATPAEPSPPIATTAEREIDIDTLAERMVDSLTARYNDPPAETNVPAEARAVEEPMPSPAASEETGSGPNEPAPDRQDGDPIETLPALESETDESEVFPDMFAKPVEAEMDTETIDDEAAIEKDGTPVTDLGVRTEADVESAQPVETTKSEKIRAEGETRGAVVPWAATETAAGRRRTGRGWRWIVAAAVISAIAITTWMILAPKERASANTRLAQNAAAEPDRPPGRFEGFTQPVPVDRHETETEPNDPLPAAETLAETNPQSAVAPAETRPVPARDRPGPPAASASKLKSPTSSPTSRAATPAPKPVEPKRASTPKSTATTPAPSKPEPKTSTAVAKRTSSPRPATPPAAKTRPESEPRAVAVLQPKPATPPPASKASEQETTVTAEARPSGSTDGGKPAPATRKASPASTVESSVSQTPAEPEVQPEPVPSRPAETTPAASGTTGPAVNSAPIEPPQLVSRQEPIYPARARKRGEGGVVELRVLVNEQGRVVRVMVESGLSGSEFEARAIDAALRSTYRPATAEGRPVRAWVTERFVFEP